MEQDRADDRGVPEGETAGSSDQQSDAPARQATASDAEQAVINQEKAFESGEENPV